MTKIIGIDLGTTNSVVAVIEGGDPEVISTAEGSRLLPLLRGQLSPQAKIGGAFGFMGDELPGF